jgi:transcriptional regulator with XRE-family HTH domain
MLQRLGKKKPRSKLVKRHSRRRKLREEELLAPSGAPPLSLEQEIGKEIRRIRSSLDLTVAQLGAMAGITPGMLSKIENGSISPSLSTLSALARALNISVRSFFAESGDPRDCSFVKAGKGLRIDRRGTKVGHQYNMLVNSLAGDIGVEPFLVTLKKDAQPYPHFRHKGVEFIYMLSGKVRYRHRETGYVLEPGDALFFDASSKHGPEELIEVPMQYLSIIIYPHR